MVKETMKRKTVAVMLILVCMLSLLGTACGNKATDSAKKETEESSAQKEESAQTDKGESEHIVITEPARGFLWAPVYLAQTMGFFEEEGIEAEFQTVTGGDPGAVSW